MRQAEKKHPQGAIAIISLMGVTAVVLLMVGTASVLAVSGVKMTDAESATEQTFYAAELGLNEGLFQIKTDASPRTFCLSFHGSSLGYDRINNHCNASVDGSIRVDIKPHPGPNPEDRYKRIVASAAEDLTGKKRSLEMTVTTNTFAGGFNYAVQSGDGGVLLDNNSVIYGDVFSNGSIIPASGGATGTVQRVPPAEDPDGKYPGNVWVANAGNRMEKVDVRDGDAHADTIASVGSLAIRKKAYYQTVSGAVKADNGSELCANASGGVFCRWRTDPIPERRDLAIRDDPGFSHVQPWVDEINDPTNPNPPIPPSAPSDCPNGYQTGTYCVYTSDVTLGRQRINGNLYVGKDSGPGKRTLTLTANVYVTGDIIIDNNVIIKVAGSGSQSAALIAEGVIDVDNGSLLQGTTDVRSFLLVVSRSSSDDTGGNKPAIYASNNSVSVIFAAPKGMVKVKNLGHLRATIANIVKLEPRSDVKFNVNLSGFFIPSEDPTPPVIDHDSWEEL